MEDENTTVLWSKDVALRSREPNIARSPDYVIFRKQLMPINAHPLKKLTRTFGAKNKRKESRLNRPRN